VAAARLEHLAVLTSEVALVVRYQHEVALGGVRQ
jgi:hypothetical protein